MPRGTTSSFSNDHLTVNESLKLGTFLTGTIDAVLIVAPVRQLVEDRHAQQIHAPCPRDLDAAAGFEVKDTAEGPQVRTLNR